MSGALLQFLGSLAAILILAWIASRLKLGGAATIDSEADARRIADQVVSGFEPAEIAISQARDAALMRDADGRIMLVRKHGSHFAGRILDHRASATTEGSTLTVASGEKRFGSVDLRVGKPQAWVQAISAID